ncbi:MAG: hypothetical protein H6R06_3580 [Proteobacteria bacterium]|jgi:hypothetical protein|nr:hypothetical protein [Pseudomonadota bacterium]
MHRRLVPLPLRRPLVGLLMCALLLTQALGLLHRVLHADGHAHAAHEHGSLEELFAHDPGSADCQIFDQLSHADGMGFCDAEPGAMPPAQPPASAQQAPRWAAQAAGYLARGPPTTA